MTFDPSALALCAFVLLGSALLTEAYLTYRDWYRRWRERRRPMPAPRVRRQAQFVAVAGRSASDSIRWSVRRWISGTGHSAGPVRGGWETRRTTITSPTGVTGGCIAPTTS